MVSWRDLRGEWPARLRLLVTPGLLNLAKMQIVHNTHIRERTHPHAEARDELGRDTAERPVLKGLRNPG